MVFPRPPAKFPDFSLTSSIRRLSPIFHVSENPHSSGAVTTDMTYEKVTCRLSASVFITSTINGIPLLRPGML